MCQGITDQWCILPRCTGKPMPKEFSDMKVSDEQKAQEVTHNIRAGIGYWSPERVMKRAYPPPVKGFLGEHTPEARNSERAQNLAVAESAVVISEWLDEINANGDLSDKEKETMAFMAGIAQDRTARINHTAHNGLYRDDPPLMKRPANA